MQLKYPSFPGRLSSYQSGVRSLILKDTCPFLPVDLPDNAPLARCVQIMYRDHSYHAAPSYAAHLADLASSPQALVAEDRTVQFPFVAGVGSTEKTEEELENQKRKREEATKRLKEQAARQRQEKVSPSFACDCVISIRCPATNLLTP